MRIRDWFKKKDIKHVTLDNEWHVYFEDGSFDKWCVYVTHIPFDKEYFQQLKNLSDKYGRDTVYDDFLKMYRIANREFNQTLCLKMAEEIDMKYEENTTILWVILYMTMVAEENKDNAILGKRIKNLGVYNVLFDELDIDYVIKYMKNENNEQGWWKKLDKLMKERGI